MCSPTVTANCGDFRFPLLERTSLQTEFDMTQKLGRIAFCSELHPCSPCSAALRGKCIVCTNRTNFEGQPRVMLEPRAHPYFCGFQVRSPRIWVTSKSARDICTSDTSSAQLSHAHKTRHDISATCTDISWGRSI